MLRGAKKWVERGKKTSRSLHTKNTIIFFPDNRDELNFHTHNRTNVNEIKLGSRKFNLAGRRER